MYTCTNYNYTHPSQMPFFLGSYMLSRRTFSVVEPRVVALYVVSEETAVLRSAERLASSAKPVIAIIAASTPRPSLALVSMCPYDWSLHQVNISL